MAYPDPRAPYYLYTDASDYAIAADDAADAADAAFDATNAVDAAYAADVAC